MYRLASFDYKSPFFYMVTLKRLKGLEAFSEIEANGLVENEITKAFNAAIRAFSAKWRCLEPISPFVVMPDHLHLMFKIKAIPDRVALGVLVSQLAKTLRAEYWTVVRGRRREKQNPGFAPPASAGGSVLACGASAPPPPVFEPGFHDWIVKKRGQLEAFRRYIIENPGRAWLRRANARFFSQVREIDFAGRRWFAYGNAALLDLPVIEPFQCSRRLAPSSPEWTAFTASASRIGPGGAGVGTFMSPCEKECGNLIAKAGGSLIVLSPEGFAPRWHPPRVKERFCAAGRMLFLSLYESAAAKPDNATLYRRCHEMGDAVVAALHPAVK